MAYHLIMLNMTETLKKWLYADTVENLKNDNFSAKNEILAIMDNLLNDPTDLSTWDIKYYPRYGYHKILKHEINNGWHTTVFYKKFDNVDCIFMLNNTIHGPIVNYEFFDKNNNRFGLGDYGTNASDDGLIYAFSVLSREFKIKNNLI